MEIDPLDRAQIIVEKFRLALYEKQERLLAEQVAHEITKRELESMRNTVAALNDELIERDATA